jgi:hypothetical protein
MAHMDSDLAGRASAAGFGGEPGSGSRQCVRDVRGLREARMGVGAGEDRGDEAGMLPKCLVFNRLVRIVISGPCGRGSGRSLLVVQIHGLCTNFESGSGPDSFVLHA